MKHPISGTKAVLVQGMFNCIPINAAAEAVREYRAWQNTKVNLPHVVESMDGVKDSSIIQEEEIKAKLIMDEYIREKELAFSGEKRIQY